MNQTVSGHLNSPASPLSLHNRTNPEPLSKLASDQGFRKPGSANSNFTKSSSDSNVLRPKVSTLSISENGSPERKRKVSFPNMLRSPTKQSLDTIDEQDDLARNYRVEVQHPGSEEKVVRSPLKKLFGDKGMLGKSASAKDFSDSGSKKTGFAHWSGKIKSRVDDMVSCIPSSLQLRRLADLELQTQELTEKIQNFEISHKRSPSGGPSNFPVSLSPYVQGDFYMQLELLLNIESNNFLMHELEADRISVSSIKTIAEQWRNKGRPQVLGLRFDLITQRELVGLNVETMHFSGVNSFHKQRLLGVLAAWRVLAKEISIRTFCQPDSAVKKHLHDAEKVLEAMNASGDSMLAFQEMRSRVTTEIYKEERLDTERRVYNGVQRQWSPSKKHAARF